MADDQAKLQAKVQQLQSLATQLQQLSQQRGQMEAMQHDSNAALEALATLADGGAVYRSIGSLLIQDDRDAAVGRIKDDVETMQVRIKRATQQEGQLREALEKLQSELQASFGKAQG